MALSVTLAPNAESFQDHFYVIKEFVMPCDGLLDKDSLISHGIDVFFSRHAISRRSWFFPFMTDSVSPLTVNAVGIRSVTLDCGLHPCPLEGKRSPSKARPVAGVISGD